MAPAKTKSAATKNAPWEKAAPPTSKHTSMSGREKTEAKARAKKADRPYPNLVDNMAVTSKRNSTKKR
jgi:hypothetical protein